MEEKSRAARVPLEGPVVCFGPYKLDLRSAELRKNDLRIRLQDQPFQILVALLDRPGGLVLREEIRQKLWRDDTVVEFDHSINAAVKRLRDALRDSAENPRYIETVASRGYRFIGRVEAIPPLEAAASLNPQSAPLVKDEPAATATAPTSRRSATQHRKRRWILVGAAAALVTGIAISLLLRSGSVSTPQMLTRLTFDSGLTTDPAASPDGKLMAYASDRGGSQNLHIWVQQFMNGGQAVQLTHGDTDDHQPSFSPDGSKIVFTSERDGGGIFVIPIIGGEPTLIAKGGRDPRFSPDGRWVAYWLGSMLGAPFDSNSGTVYVIPSAGGPPQPVRSDLTEAGVPVWSPDGKRLIVFGRKDDLPPPVGHWNWWVVPVEGGSAMSTDAFASLQRQGIKLGRGGPRIANWRGHELLFFARLGDSMNVWKIHIANSDWRVSGEPERLTSGTGLDAYPSETADGRLLFASLTNSSDVSALPVNTNAVKDIGQPRRVTETIGPHQGASLSANGKLLAYSSVRYGHPHAWIKDLESGREISVTSDTASENNGQLSADGSLLVYLGGNQDQTGLIVPVRGGTADQFCTDCDSAYDISADNKVVLYRRGNSIRAFDLLTRHDSLFMRSERDHLYQDTFSPDGRWVVFEAVRRDRSRLYIAALRNSVTPAPESEWIPVTGDEGWADKPRWSPDGKVIYFISNRDGFFCLWAQRLAADSKEPTGPPVSISHFHKSRISMGNVGAGGVMEISVARDKIAFNLGELTGNIWVRSLSH